MPRSGQSPRLAVTRLEDRTTPAPVGLDPTFATAGRFLLADTFNLTGAPLPRRVAALPDGRSLVAMTGAGPAGDPDFVVFRLTADGTFDPTFGTGGFATVAFNLGGPNTDIVTSLAVLDDGRILVAGYAGRVDDGDTDFAVARLTADGKLDTTFDGDGKATVAFNLGGQNRDVANGVAVDSAGRVVLGGYAEGASTNDFDFAAVRLTAAGALDATFSGDGKAVVAFNQTGGTKEDVAAAVAVGPGDTVVLAGAVSSGPGTIATGVARLLADGAPDTSLGGTGRQVFPTALGSLASNSAGAVAVAADGRILLAGSGDRSSSGNTDMYVARLTGTGTPDPTFGVNGFTAVAFDRGGANGDVGNALAVDAAGNILVAGSVQVGDTDFSYGVARVTPTGGIDPTFDGEGVVVVAFDRGGSKGDAATGLAVQPDGRILLSGVVEVATDVYDAGLVRLEVGAAVTPSDLVVGGSPGGTAAKFTVGTTGQYAAAGSFNPFGSSVVRPAAADVNGDGVADAIYAVGPGGGSLVRVVDGATGQDLAPATATFESTFTGGLFVAAGDVDGDGNADVIVSPDVGGGGRVQAFAVRGGALVRLANFFGIDDPNFRGGARVAAGDVNGDGTTDVVVGAGFGGGPRVAVFDGTTLTQANPTRLTGDFFAFPGADAERLRNGVFVAAGDVNADGRAELIFGGGPGGGPRVFVLDGRTVLATGAAAAQASPVANFFVAGDSNSRGGVRLAVKDTDGDGRADLVTGTGDGLPARVRVYLGTAFPAAGEPAAFQDFPVLDGATLANGVFVG